MQTKQNTFMESKIGEVLKKKRSLIESKKTIDSKHQLSNCFLEIANRQKPLIRKISNSSSWIFEASIEKCYSNLVRELERINQRNFNFHHLLW
jgi:hypothetical protein